MDILTLLIWAAFYVLFGVSIRRWLQHRDPVELAVVLVFSSTAALFALSAVNQVAPALSATLSPLSVMLLTAQPVLILRLVGLIVPLARWVLPAAVAVWLVTIAAYYLTDRSAPAILAVVGYFFIVELLAAARLVMEASRRHGLPRIRLATAGAASALFGLSIFVAGLGSAASGGGGATVPWVQVISRVLALFAGVGYLAAFAPPRWLLRLGHRAVAFDLVRSIVSAPTGTEPRVLWRGLAAAAAEILGTRQAIVETDDGAVGVTPDRDRATELLSDAVKRTALIEIPLVSEGRRIATLVAIPDGRPLFIEDDIALLELLGSLTARAVERERAFDRLAEAARAVQESDALRASEARFRALLDADPNAILALDWTDRVTWCTRSAADMFETSEAGLIGRPLGDLIELSDVSSSDARSENPTTKGAPRFETAARRADGSTFPAEVALTEVDLDGLPMRLAVVSDVGWRHEVHAIRERFIGVLSHELRTPITSIFGGTQVLLSRGERLDPATRQDLLVTVAGEAERLQRMIENLLVMAKVERGADVVELNPVLIGRVLPQVIERERAQWPSMQLSLALPPDLPVVAAEDNSLSLIVRNLVSNAGKYAGPDASVEVRLGLDASGNVTVRVLDDGPGISDDEAEDLFALYFRSDRSAAAPGSGIGLFVCRQLVSAMGGRVWARSRPEGGAEFGFTLQPYGPEHEPDAEPPAREIVLANGSSKPRLQPAPATSDPVAPAASNAAG
jgi:PAS domain S-box-containing protein